MKFFAVLLLASLSAAPAYSGPDKTLISARETILSSTSTPQDALLKYNAAARKSAAPAVMAEYAYALAYAGLGEDALYQLDRALLAEPLNAEVRFYLSEILNAFGLDDASAELAAPVPGWLGTPLELPRLETAPPPPGTDAAVAEVNRLLAQKRLAEAAVLLDRLCRVWPGNARYRVGYAMALEKLGAYKAAAAQARRDMELSESPERKAVAAAFAAELEKRPPLKYHATPVNTLKGRYLAYLGGSLNRADSRTTYALNGRVGKFISERLDVSANAGINNSNANSDYNGLTLGTALRYNLPLGFEPISATLAAKAERIPAPDKNLTMLLSPGLTYFTRAGSLDWFLDIALSGAYSGSVTMSMGYTIYFGGGK